MLAKPTQYVFRLAYINHFIGFIDQEVNERLAIGHIEGIGFKFARKHYACKRPTRDETGNESRYLDSRSAKLPDKA